jgi:hypothetical protein
MRQHQHQNVAVPASLGHVFPSKPLSRLARHAFPIFPSPNTTYFTAQQVYTAVSACQQRWFVQIVVDIAAELKALCLIFPSNWIDWPHKVKIAQREATTSLRLFVEDLQKQPRDMLRTGRCGKVADKEIHQLLLLQYVTTYNKVQITKFHIAALVTGGNMGAEVGPVKGLLPRHADVLPQDFKIL